MGKMEAFAILGVLGLVAYIAFKAYKPLHEIGEKARSIIPPLSISPVRVREIETGVYPGTTITRAGIYYPWESGFWLFGSLPKWDV